MGQIGISRHQECFICSSRGMTLCFDFVVQETAVRLSGYQAALLLSVLWLQASLPDNLPDNFEAIAHTYMLTLMFSRPKVRRP